MLISHPELLPLGSSKPLLASRKNKTLKFHPCTFWDTTVIFNQSRAELTF